MEKSVLSNDCHFLNKLKERGEIADIGNYLRIDDNIFQMLLNKVTPLIEKQNTTMREAIPTDVRLIATLGFLAIGSSYKDLKFSIRISPQALKRLNKTMQTVRLTKLTA